MTRSRAVVFVSLFLLVVLALLPPVALVAFERAYRDRVYPGVTIDNSITHRQDATITLLSTTGSIETSWKIPVKDFGLAIDQAATREKLLSIGRSGNFRDDMLVKLRAYRDGINVAPALTVDRTLIDTVVASVSGELDTPPVEPKFRLSGTKVLEFRQGSAGRAVDRELLAQQIVAAVFSDQRASTIEVPISPVQPKTNAGKTSAETLGIRELLGKGVSRYNGSIQSRKHNIAITTERLDGVLISPGDTFSFNDTVGDVSQETGYQSAYIIENGRTILGDGGGVCQDSTTLFRAALNSGLPIIERRAHSYRVGYYEQNSPPGFDATIYAPSPDFKFKNDTPASILIQAKADNSTNTLTIELWGTSDGRIATTTKPVVTDVVPPPEDLYQDDPSLRSGQVKQVDWKASGAKVTFSYSVKRNGETIYQKSFISLYRPWQAVFLRGTGG